MKKWASLLVLAFFLTPRDAFSETPCGEAGLVCSDHERCSEHVVAIFSKEHVSSPPYVQGQCLPKDQKSDNFWCGNQECRSGFFGSPSVCCVNTPNYGATPEYACAYSELSCPGNSQRLTIRDNQPNRTLRRG
jgi:hypothetical protein